MKNPITAFRERHGWEVHDLALAARMSDFPIYQAEKSRLVHIPAAVLDLARMLEGDDTAREMVQQYEAARREASEALRREALEQRAL